MYIRCVKPCAKFRIDRGRLTWVKLGFQLLADFALLMAQNASFGNEVKGHPEISHFTYSSLLNGADGLEMYDYTRNDSNIRVYIDFERDREGDELFHFFALKSVQKCNFR